jgi:hypothetical protein
MAKKVRQRTKATKKAQKAVPQAIVSDQSASFASVVIGTGTVVATLKLPPGSWVIFATVALAAATSALGTTVVQTMFALDGELFGQDVQTDFTITNTGSSINGFRVVPLTTGMVLDKPKTLQVVCTAAQANTVSSQPTTITAIQAGSVTRIT